jgi:hypothetical protein
MKTTSRLVLSIAALSLAGMLPAAESPTAAAVPTPLLPAIPVAHSALLTIDATRTDDSLALHIKHAGTEIPIDGRDVTVSVDGKNEPVMAEPEGTFVLSAKDLAGDGERQLDIVVAHDGIREILTGKIALPKANVASDLWRDHKQMAWWILNIAIVMIAVLAFSRRSAAASKQADEDD